MQGHAFYDTRLGGFEVTTDIASVCIVSFEGISELQRPRVASFMCRHTTDVRVNVIPAGKELHTSSAQCHRFYLA